MVNSTHAACIYVLDDPLNGVDLTGLRLSGFGWFRNNAGYIDTGLTVTALVVGAIACTIPTWPRWESTRGGDLAGLRERARVDG